MENEIKVGEFCRTSNGKVFKCSEIVLGYIPKDENKTMIVQNIIKHSPNLKDLIQKDDFVNGDRVVAIDYTEDENGNYVDVLGIMEIDDDYAYPVELRVINIQNVVTKEQFESISYKVTKM